MLKQHKRLWLLTALLTLAPVLVGLIFWNRLPEVMATHWGIDGTADGWSGKPFAVFGLPCFLVAVHCLCLLITAKDKSNDQQSRKAVAMVFWIVPVISWFTCGVVYVSALGKGLSLTALVPVLLGSLFAIVGNYMPKVRQNRTIGIKVPWTYSSEENWNKTHRFAGKLWVAGGIVMMLLAFLPQKWSFTVLFVLILLLAVIPMAYSYVLYRKDKKSRT